MLKVHNINAEQEESKEENTNHRLEDLSDKNEISDNDKIEEDTIEMGDIANDNDDGEDSAPVHLKNNNSRVIYDNFSNSESRRRGRPAKKIEESTNSSLIYGIMGVGFIGLSLLV